MKNFVKMLGLLWVGHHAFAGVIYGVNQVPSHYQSVHYPVYVQIGSFTKPNVAEKLKRQAQAHTHATVVVRKVHDHYQVVVGPFRQASSLKAFFQQMNQSGRHLNRFRSNPFPLKTAVDALFDRPVTSTSALVKTRLSSSSKRAIAGKWTPKHQALINNHQGTYRNLHPEFSVFLGGTYIPNALDGQTLQLLPYEVGPYADTFTHQSGAGAFTWGLAAQYQFKLETFSLQSTILDALAMGIHFYQIVNFNQTGEVKQFNFSEFTNYTDTLGLNNVRVMANFGFDFHPIQWGLVPFVEGGIGTARTVLSYESTPIAPVDSPRFTLLDATHWTFAYQVGVGAKYAWNTYMDMSLRYLYANMGNISSSVIGSSTNLATPLVAYMSTQNILFGLTYKMG